MAPNEITAMLVALLLAVASAATNKHHQQYPNANALAQQQQQQQQPQQQKELQTCIDDSDCQSLGPGNAYRCFSVRKREKKNLSLEESG